MDFREIECDICISNTFFETCVASIMPGISLKVGTSVPCETCGSGQTFHCVLVFAGMCTGWNELCVYNIPASGSGSQRFTPLGTNHTIKYDPEPVPPTLQFHNLFHSECNLMSSYFLLSVACSVLARILYMFLVSPIWGTYICWFCFRHWK